MALSGYYRVRSAIPRSTQIAARRLYSRLQGKQRFPRWPVESSLHDLYDFLLETTGALLDEPMPILSFGPPVIAGRSCSLTMSRALRAIPTSQLYATSRARRIIAPPGTSCPEITRRPEIRH